MARDVTAHPQLSAEDLDRTPPSDCDGYRQTNAQLHGAFVVRMWRTLLESAEDMDMANARLHASRRKRFSLSLRDCKPFDDAAAVALARALPSTLTELRIDNVALTSATAAGARVMLETVLGRADLVDGFRVLHLYDCMLSGALPEAVGDCISLRELGISNNQLSSAIPATLFRCVHLETLMLFDNHLEGQVRELTAISPDLAPNFPPPHHREPFHHPLRRSHRHHLARLPAQISEEIGQCVALRTLELHNNRLCGSIPNSLGRCVKLVKLSLYGNQLTGPIPASLGDCSDLRLVYLSDNKLSGPIPESLGRCHRVEKLGLYDNKLSGHIPSSLGNCTALVSSPLRFPLRFPQQLPQRFPQRFPKQLPQQFPQRFPQLDIPPLSRSSSYRTEGAAEAATPRSLTHTTSASACAAKAQAL